MVWRQSEKSLERRGEESRSTEEREREMVGRCGVQWDDSVNSIELLPMRDLRQCKIESF